MSSSIKPGSGSNPHSIPHKSSIRRLQRFGDAVQVTFVLSDWENFGLSERVCYHFDLLETLSSDFEIPSSPEVASESSHSTTYSYDSVCGVSRLLECVPDFGRVTKHQRRIPLDTINNAVKDFNLTAQRVRQDPQCPYHQPSQLPLPLSPRTRVSFAYEMTRVAFVLDANPTLVSSYGMPGHHDAVCALDRLSGMVETLFTSIIEPIDSYNTADQWKPLLAVTVLAVYPNGGNDHDNNATLLVRDFRVHDIASAKLLADKIIQWALGDVENEIARRLNTSAIGSFGFDNWTAPKYTSSLQDLLDAGDIALSLLPSRGRPCIILATDGRSISCESILDLFTEQERIDNPLHVLDLSSPATHKWKSAKLSGEFQEDKQGIYLDKDPGGPFSFPLHLPDNCETLHSICKATGGAFLDSKLVQLAAKESIGRLSNKEESLGLDEHIKFKWRAWRINVLQWYFLFSLSPLTASNPDRRGPQQSYPLVGQLAPPDYLRQTYQRSDSKDKNWDRKVSLQTPEEDTMLRRERDTMTFLTYHVPNVRIKGLLMVRLKEGYRASKYGHSTEDLDKVSIQLQLPIENGAILHYQFEYTARKNFNPMHGNLTTVKVGLSGDPLFVQATYNFSIQRSPIQNPLINPFCVQLSNFIKATREGDKLISALCPLVWEEKLDSSNSPFVQRLGALSNLQRLRNFRSKRFDLVYSGKMPCMEEENPATSDIFGEQSLFDGLLQWSTQTVISKRMYLKRVDTSDGLTAYAIVAVAQSAVAARLFTVRIDMINASSIDNRFALTSSLELALSLIKGMKMLPKPLNHNLVDVRNPFWPSNEFQWRQKFLINHFDHESWDLVKHPELLSLLTRRRSEIANFHLLHSTDSYALFAKYISVQSGKVLEQKSGEGYLVEYQIELKDEKSSPVVNMHVETEVGRFFLSSSRNLVEHMTRAHRMFVRVKSRDQDCGYALRSRTALLQLMNDNGDKSTLVPTPNEQKSHVRRLLAYAARNSRNIRFFGDGASAANKALERLTIALMLSGELGSKVVLLDISPSSSVGDEEPGFWFLVRYDRHTIGIVQLPQKETKDFQESSGTEISNREVTFFTFGTSDLYCVRDDVEDDDSASDHIGDYPCVEGFADEIEAAHGKNFAQAAYLGLRQCQDPKDFTFAPGDFDHALSFCHFVKVSEVYISQESLLGDKSSKLFQTVTTLLSPVTGSDSLMYYSAKEPYFQKINSQDESVDNNTSDMSYEQLSDDSDEDIIDTYSNAEVDITESRRTSSEKEGVAENPDILPPIFLKFAIDGVNVPYRQLSSITQSSHLAVFASTYKIDYKGTVPTRIGLLAKSHMAVSSELTSLLNSYIAEQILERLRSLGRTIEDVDLVGVKKCLRRARNVLLSLFDLYFFVVKADKIMPASSPAGNEAAFEEAFGVLLTQLRSSTEITLRQLGTDTLFVIDAVDQSLKYWCLLSLKRNIGSIAIEVFHPDGITEGEGVLTSIQSFLSKCSHTTNQILLLRSRSVSKLLISDRAEEREKNKSIVSMKSFEQGHFGCEVKFKETFPLYHRCSPVQTALSLGSSVLHSFAVADRQGVYVYKDETGAIFYLSMGALSLEDDLEAVELQVYGVGEPGPSITNQLTRLLRKKILTNSVDALSKVLSFNPHYNWKRLDIEFLYSFRTCWKEVVDEVAEGEQERFLEFPVEIYDPLSVLIFFRQNLCGSTYFHRLYENSGDSEDLGAGNNPEHDEELSRSPPDDEHGTSVLFEPKDFTFFYNNVPSQLVQSFQGVSTLTEKGAQYCSKAGTGIAIIELVLTGGTEGQYFNVGQPPESIGSTISISPESLRMSKSKKTDVLDSGSLGPSSTNKYGIRIRIVSTTLNNEALFDWLELTLNQVIVAWRTERHIQRTVTGLVSESQIITREETPRQEYLKFIDKIYPGLPAFLSILESSANLPHPAIVSIDFNTVMRASSVSSTTLALLEDCILTSLMKGQRQKATGVLGDVTVIRSSRNEKPRLVRLIKQKNSRSPLVKISNSTPDQFVADSPIDCPEYLCFFSFHLYEDIDDDEVFSTPPMLFKEVMIHDGIRENRKSDLTEHLLKLKTRMPSAFRRSLAFVLSVKRNRRALTVYNWDPDLWRDAKSRIKALESANNTSLGDTLHMQQKRCLGYLSPPVQRSGLGRPKPKASSEAKQQGRLKKTEKVEPNQKPVKRDHRQPMRRIQRPTFIRQPKLIGKSVEGAAMQAIEARRRASSHRLKTPAATSISQRSRRNKLRQSPDQGQKVGAEVISSADGRGKAPEEEERQKLLSNLKGKCGATNGYQFRFSLQTLTTTKQSWFRPHRHPVDQGVREIILQRSVKVFGDCYETLSYTRLLSDDFGLDFTNFILEQLKAFGNSIVLPTSSSHAQPKGSSVHYLMTALRAKQLVTFLVLRVVVRKSEQRGRGYVVCLDGWILRLPHPDGKGMIRERRIQKHREQFSTKVDRKVSIIQNALTIKSILFDFSAHLIQTASITTPTPSVGYEHLSLAQRLVQKYTIHQQQELPDLRWRIFEGTVVLKTYGDRYINKFNAHSLFDFLLDLEKSSVVACGSEAVCFKEPVSVCGTESCCFLRRDRGFQNQLFLVFVCRMGGNDITQYVFPNGNSVGSTLYTLLLREAALRVYYLLRWCAIEMHKNRLWDLFCTKRSSGSGDLGVSLNELCAMVKTESLMGDRVLNPLLTSGELPLSITKLLSAMTKETVFQPSHLFHDGTEGHQRFFYIDEMKVFLLFQVKQARIVKLDLVQRSVNDTDKVAAVCELLVNFTLHYLWTLM